MDLDLTPEALAFQNELRGWLAANMRRPWREELRDPAATEDGLMEIRRDWQRKLYQAGYLGMDWPAEWGGRGATEVEKSIFEEELARADAPPILNTLGIGLLGPALIHHGSEEQRRRFIPPMLAGDEIWCQGFSEPGAGSDLASLRTSAVLDGDHFVLNGQKVWTTFGPWADWIFVLAPHRLEGPLRRHLVHSLQARHAGVTVRPLRQITGESEFGEVFFEDARVPTREPGRADRRRLADRDDGARLRARRRLARVSRALRARPAAARATPASEHGRLERRRRARSSARLLVENEVMRANGIRTLANFADGQGAGHRVVDREDLLERVRPALPRDGARPPRPGRPAAAHEPRRAARRRLGARVPVVARRHDLLGLVRDPAQHHRQARARPAAGLSR